MIKFIAMFILFTQPLGGITERGKIAIAQPNVNQISHSIDYKLAKRSKSQDSRLNGII